MWTARNRILAARVAGQFGLVTRTQALGSGVTPKAVVCHLDAGRWVRIHSGIYQTVPGREGWDVRAMAALLWAGDGALLFRASAGYACGLVRAEPDVVDVAVPAERRVRAADGVQVSRSRRLQGRADPVAWPHRVTAAHTVFDLAVGRPIDDAIALAARALSLRVASPDDLVVALMERPRQPRRALLLEALTDVAAGSESASEVRYVRDVERAHGLPRGRRQAPVGDGRRRDVEYEEFGVVVEIDGRIGHSAWADRQRDARRDRGAATSGRLTLRVFWTDLVPTACGLAGEVAAILTMRGWTDQPRRCGPACLLRGTSLPAWGA